MPTRYLTLAIAIALTGCGGGGGSTTASNNSTTDTTIGTPNSARDAAAYPESLVISSPFAVETTTALGALADELPHLTRT